MREREAAGIDETAEDSGTASAVTVRAHTVRTYPMDHYREPQ